MFLAAASPIVSVTNTAVATTAGSEPRPQMLFNKGIFLMEDGNYQQAIEIFRQIEQEGRVSGPLFYNTGISYLYLDSLGKASWYFHKSTRFRNTASSGAHAIEVVENQIRNRGTYIPRLPWYAFIDWLHFDLNHYSWIIRGLVLLNIGIILLLVGWLYFKDDRVALVGKVAAATAVVLILATSLLYIWSNNYQQGVIVGDAVPIQPVPGNFVEEDLTPDLAYEAYTVTLDLTLSREYTGWMYVRLQNGVAGWVPESAVRTL